MPGSLSGQVLIMTGGAMGFGECMAKAAAREGASVMIADANLPEAERVMDAIESAGGTAAAVEADVTDGAQVRNMTEETVGGFGHVDVLVNNAGVSGPSREFVDIEKQDWDAVMDINVNGPFLCCRAVLLHMIERRSGHIVNISSATARVGFTHLRSIPYTTTKFAVEGLFWTLSVLMKDHGIRANAICPGLAVTNFQAVPQGILRGRPLLDRGPHGRPASLHPHRAGGHGPLRRGHRLARGAGLGERGQLHPRLESNCRDGDVLASQSARTYRPDESRKMLVESAFDVPRVQALGYEHYLGRTLFVRPPVQPGHREKDMLNSMDHRRSIGSVFHIEDPFNP